MSNLKAARDAAGLTQAALAERAGVSRQMVGAVEAGRHVPRVDTALALSAALGVPVGDLFGTPSDPVDAVSGERPGEGSLVRVGRVGERVVTSPARTGPGGWGVADGLIESGAVTPFHAGAAGMVVAGCEPGLTVLEQILREGGMSAVAATSSSSAAASALAAGRLHAAVIHGPGDRSLPAGVDVAVFQLARWEVGLAAHPDSDGDWVSGALSGRAPVIQREDGAGVQRAFIEALDPASGVVEGPRVSSHFAAARRAMVTGMPAVTIGPASIAAGALFHPLEVHDARMWVSPRWLQERLVIEALAAMSGARFQRRLRGVGGYDLTGSGARVT